MVRLFCHCCGRRLAHNVQCADMFHLWTLAESDLLSENVPYRLRDTGQGLNRVQAAPKTSRMMHAILNRAQRSIGSWVGSSVIHMGDHNVPNALMFIGEWPPVSKPPVPIPVLSDADDFLFMQTSTRKSTASSSRSATRSRRSPLWPRTPRCGRTLRTNGARRRASPARSSRTSSGTGSTAPGPGITSMQVCTY